MSTHKSRYAYGRTAQKQYIYTKRGTKSGLRRGDTIPRQLFMATPESIHIRLKRGNKAVNIDGDSVDTLRFADDIF